jgi:hypothetical protein
MFANASRSEPNFWSRMVCIIPELPGGGVGDGLKVVELPALAVEKILSLFCVVWINVITDFDPARLSFRRGSKFRISRRHAYLGFCLFLPG